ncbi:hypothetical protein [Massilia soli]|uniref:Uncharacterized protein n=1 Tax=Massilia soli TaxID=2792854 RepID=A0ABS7SLW5_9BURK|nr:hypothetical protein [Massilia soli]MBZ2207173.1 hypothetical protein [Massilia soli]
MSMPVSRLEKAPMKLLFSFCLLIVSSAALADTPGQPCETFAPTDKVSAPLTIAKAGEHGDTIEEARTEVGLSTSAVRVHQPKMGGVYSEGSTRR